MLPVHPPLLIPCPQKCLVPVPLISCTTFTSVKLLRKVISSYGASHHLFFACIFLSSPRSLSWTYIHTSHSPQISLNFPYYQYVAGGRRGVGPGMRGLGMQWRRWEHSYLDNVMTKFIINISQVDWRQFVKSTQSSRHYLNYDQKFGNLVGYRLMTMSSPYSN